MTWVINWLVIIKTVQSIGTIVWVKRFISTKLGKLAPTYTRSNWASKVYLPKLCSVLTVHVNGQCMGYWIWKHDLNFCSKYCKDCTHIKQKVNINVQWNMGKIKNYSLPMCILACIAIWWYFDILKINTLIGFLELLVVPQIKLYVIFIQLSFG